MLIWFRVTKLGRFKSITAERVTNDIIMEESRSHLHGFFVEGRVIKLA